MSVELALQHTFAVAAIGSIDICLSSCKPDKGSELEKNFQRINSWLEEVAEQTLSKKHLSAAARRALNRFVDVMDRHTIKKGMSEDRANHQYAALVWCALTYIEHVRYACPEYGKGPKRVAWCELWRLLDLWAGHEIRLNPGADETGTGIYEETAWALEGVDFIAPQLEAK